MQISYQAVHPSWNFLAFDSFQDQNSLLSSISQLDLFVCQVFNWYFFIFRLNWKGTIYSQHVDNQRTWAKYYLLLKLIYMSIYFHLQRAAVVK